MRYIGGKSQIATRLWREAIAPLWKAYTAEVDSPGYFEPFMGGCNFYVRNERYIDENAAVYLTDLNKKTVYLTRALQRGWTPPDTITRKEWSRCRELSQTYKTPSHLHEWDDDTQMYLYWAGYAASFRGTYYGSFGSPENPGQSYRWAIRHAKAIQRATVLEPAPYHTWNPKGLFIYCDPPYAGTVYARNYSKLSQWTDDEHKQFWDTMAAWSRYNVVVVSEITAPPEWECIWERSITRGIQHNKSVERLFTLYNRHPPTYPAETAQTRPAQLLAHHVNA